MQAFFKTIFGISASKCLSCTITSESYISCRSVSEIALALYLSSAHKFSTNVWWPGYWGKQYNWNLTTGYFVLYNADITDVDFCCQNFDAGVTLI